MADRPSLTEIVLFDIGIPKEPFGLEEWLVLFALAAAFLAYAAVEYGVGRLIRRMFAGIAAKARQGGRPPRPGDPSP
jgi:hypothetical protein